MNNFVMLKELEVLIEQCKDFLPVYRVLTGNKSIIILQKPCKMPW